MLSSLPKLEVIALHGHRLVNGAVPTGPSTNPVDQPIDLLAIRPAHTTSNTVCK
jgi:hypothetical protein